MGVAIWNVIAAISFIAKTSALRINQNIGVNKEPSVAVCITGGLRKFTNCSQSLHNFILGDTSMGGPVHMNLATYVATWGDYDTEYPYEDVSERVREVYKGMNLVNISVLSHKEATKEATVVLKKLSPQLYQGALRWGGGRHPHPGWFLSPYMQSVLWEKCIQMVPPSVDVIVRVRPDFFFNENVLRWEGQSDESQGPFFSYRDKRYQIDNAKIFLWGSSIHKNFDDDTFMMGSRQAMNLGVASLRPALEEGLHKVSDVVYYESLKRHSIKLPEPAFGNDAPWRDSFPELLLQHHLRYAGLTDVSLGNRGDAGHIVKR